MERSQAKLDAWRARSKSLARGAGPTVDRDRYDRDRRTRGSTLRQRTPELAGYYRNVRAPLVERMTGPGAFCAAPALFALARVDDPLPHCSGPLDVHERRRRTQGGSLEEPTNLLTICRAHNGGAADACRGDAWNVAGIVAFEGDPGWAVLGARRGERKQRA